MRKLNLLLVLIVLGSAVLLTGAAQLTIETSYAAPAAVAANPAPLAAGGTYVVQPGDTLTAIAARFGVSVAQLVAANGLADPNHVHAGEVLTIPDAGAPPATTPVPPATPRTYAVQPGDTLYGIAARFGLTADQLAAANGLADRNRIYVGQVLTISDASAPPAATATPAPPAPGPATGSTVSYVVQPGDNLSRIAARFGTTVAAIQANNAIDNPNLVFAGTVLKIVVGDQTSQPPTPAPPGPPSGNHGGARWIDVNLSTQTLRAYEGDSVVYTTLVSTGIPRHPTPTGTFGIYTKYRAQDMSGGTGPEYYYLPNVPYVMYFYGAYALHGTYWHNNFGHPMSHGCVNLPTSAAGWIYSWASIGTNVTIHW